MTRTMAIIALHPRPWALAEVTQQPQTTHRVVQNAASPESRATRKTRKTLDVSKVEACCLANSLAGVVLNGSISGLD